jgi:MYXO-CTERM domain-containing protein
MTDEEPPDVEITAPADGETFSDAPAVVDVSVEADDGDGSGVKEVWLEIDGEEQALGDDSPPFDFEGISLPEGSIEIVALAEDHSGNVGVSSPVVVVVGDSDSSPDGSDGSDGETGDEEVTEGEDDEEAAPGAEDEDAGCACRSREAAEPPWALLLLPLIAARGRRPTSSAGRTWLPR